MLRLAADAGPLKPIVLYNADPPEAVRVLALDSLTAIYHRRSGQTHVVTEPVPEILMALKDSAADVVTLAERLGVAVHGYPALTARLDELIASGLVFRR
jgi:PqqD family protein of HPr-rel-A system